MDLNHIGLFINLVEAGSLTQAAKKLNIAKSNLSRALSSLEKELGTQLIYRNTRNFSITEAGKDYYNKCKGPLVELKLAREIFTNQEATLKGKMTITSATDVAHTILPMIASDFSGLYPELALDIRAEDRYVDLVKEGVDLALRMGKLVDSNLKALKISDISLILVASPEYLQTHSRIKHLEQLGEHRLISFNKKFEKHFTLIGRNAKTEKIKVHSNIQVNNPILAKELVLCGKGIALLPDFICYEEIKNNRLVRLFSDFRSGSSPLHFVWPANIAQPLKVRTFIEFTLDPLRKYFISKLN